MKLLNNPLPNLKGPHPPLEKLSLKQTLISIRKKKKLLSLLPNLLKGSPHPLKRPKKYPMRIQVQKPMKTKQPLIHHHLRNTKRKAKNRKKKRKRRRNLKSPKKNPVMLKTPPNLKTSCLTENQLPPPNLLEYVLSHQRRCHLQLLLHLQDLDRPQEVLLDM